MGKYDNQILVISGGTDSRGWMNRIFPDFTGLKESWYEDCSAFASGDNDWVHVENLTEEEVYQIIKENQNVISKLNNDGFMTYLRLQSLDKS